MPIGTRQLSVLGEFKPFGLIAEALDGGKPLENAGDTYKYFLFHPHTACERDADVTVSDSHDFGDGDHELFIRGNRMIWSTGSRVHRRYTLSSSIIMACWCRMDAISEPLLCVLQFDTLTIYNSSGEISCIPLPHSIASVWPLPFGLLLQRAIDESHPPYLYFPSSSPLLNVRDLSRSNREYGSNPQNNVNMLNSLGHNFMGSVSSMSSHLILKHPSEEPQALFVQEKGKLSAMKDYDERTIWTSDAVPLVASYNKGKMQHSLWFVEIINSNIEAASASTTVHAVVADIISKEFLLRRIWQGKCAQSAASKVFLATDDDGALIICFLLQEQKLLLAVRLQTDECNNEIIVGVEPHMSWTIPAIAASSVTVTRPRVKGGQLPFADIVVLTMENNLLLYSGKQCLCKYYLPHGMGKGLVSDSMGQLRLATDCHELKIVGLADAIDNKINVIVNNGQMFRCALRRSPSSSLADDCIAAMAEGLHPSFYNHFVVFLWGNSDFTYLSNVDSCADSEWDSFSSVIMQLCGNSRFKLPKFANKMPDTCWDFLISSKFHMSYSRHTFIKGMLSASGLDSVHSNFSGAHVLNEQSQDKSFYRQLLMETLDSLHALYESLKLDNHRKHDLVPLVTLLCHIATCLGEASYIDYYLRDFPCLLQKVEISHSNCASRVPPCLFRWLENCLLYGCRFVNCNDIPPLICKDGCSVVSWARKIVSFYSLLLGSERIGRKLSTGVYCNIAKGSASTPEELTVLAMVAEGFGLRQLDLLPAGVSLPLRHALETCRESPPSDWPAAAYVLVGREDLALRCFESSSNTKGPESHASMNLVSISAPYMLHLHPVTIPPSISDMAGLDGVKVEDTDSLDGLMADGMEHMFDASSQLRFGRDLRLNEVRRLLCSARPVAIQTSVNPSASDQDLQQAQLWQLAQRTTALPFGRGAFTLATTCTLLTEALAIPKLVLAGRLPAQQNATVNLDPNIRNMVELRSWPEFHNGVAAGLRLAPFQGKMSRTWIAYNRPKEANAAHAGLLLALGLHGHLHVLVMTDVYQYLSEETDFATVGILLGMSASHRGTMNPEISKILYLHIPSRYPPSFPDLELATVLQSAALMAVGLLYEGSAHPQTMKILLGEIGRRSGGDNVLEREGYAVAAGSALGLVALGQGKDAFGVTNTLVERLFQYIGGKEFSNERLPNMVQVRDDYNRSTGQMMDGTQDNIDVTAPGATIALALIFLKTELEAVASRIAIPLTHFGLQYIRPDFIMLRVIARNMIMWSRIHPSNEWVDYQIPEIVKVGIMSLKANSNDSDEMDVEALVQGYVNIITGASISLGLRYAGTRNGDAQELLYNYAIYLLNEIKPISVTSCSSLPKGLSKYVDRCTLETCLHLIVLSLSVVMAGSGHLQTFRLLRFLRSRNSSDGHTSYGIQMAVSMAIGFLFLGGGTRAFSTGNSAVAALLIALYPRLPTGPNDNRCHLQAFRHLYVLATEARWVQTVDVDTNLPVYVPLEVTIQETEHNAETSFCEVTPCILPERPILKTVQVCGPRYWGQIIDLVPEDKPWWRSGDKNDPFNGGLLYVKRKVGSCSYVDDPIGCQSLLSRAMHKVFDNTSPNSATGISGKTIPSSFKVDQLISTFSADPSLIAFAQLCHDPSWRNRADVDFKEFCLQVLFECVSMDRPALLQVYLSLYTMIVSMTEQAMCIDVFSDSLFLSSLKLAIAYNSAVISGKLTGMRGIVQSTFIASLSKRIEEILKTSQVQDDFHNYLIDGKWPHEKLDGDKHRSTILSWYLQWFCVPHPHVVKLAVEKIKPMVPVSSAVPLLRLLLPTTCISALIGIDELCFSQRNCG